MPNYSAYVFLAFSAICLIIYFIGSFLTIYVLNRYARTKQVAISITAVYVILSLVFITQLILNLPQI